jgi:hypothetical protein
MKFFYYGTFNSNGISQYLNMDPIKEEIDTNVISEINSILPERYKLHHTHPEWLMDNSIDFIDSSELIITFVNEGAGYRNALGYFVYDTKNPPKTLNHIQECYFVLPNASKSGSGGGLNSGDKIKLAYGLSKTVRNGKNIVDPTDHVFPGGKSVGFVLYPNGWNGNGVSKYVYPFTSISSHNPEKAIELKYHTALIKLPNYDRLVYSFEDINREYSSCDHDFNDLVLLVDTDISKIGDVYTDTQIYKSGSGYNNPDKFTVGFKKAFSTIDNYIVETVVMLFIPSDSTIYKKKLYKTRMKTNKAYVKRITIVPPKTNRTTTTNYISRKINTAFSWYDPTFIYQTDQYVEETGMTESNLLGLHFFHSFKEASDYDFDPLKV